MLTMKQSKVRRWNVDSETIIELESIGRHVVECGTETIIPALNGWLPANSADNQNHGWELVIEFNSVGFSDPGVLFSAPEDCYPPESGDERTLVEAYLLRSPIGNDNNEPRHRVYLPPAIQRQLFEMFEDRVKDADLPVD